VVVAASTDAYGSRCLRDPFFAIKRGWYALVVALAVLVIGGFYLRSTQDFSRVMTGVGSAGALLLCGIGRWAVVPRLPALTGGSPFSSALIHDPGSALPPGEFSVILEAGSELNPARHDPLMYDRLATALSAMDRVVVACHPDARQAWARALRGANIQGEIYMPELASLQPLGIGPDHQAPSVIVAIGPLNLVDRIIKRGFDVCVAALMIVLLAPVMALVAMWIRLDSSGPILFQQTRIGRGNRMFRMLKFRSMRVADEAGDRSATRDDDRITRCGRFIRRTSLDELPQLFNVLGGSMSIVGPRPHALGSRANDKLFWEVHDRYWDRHAAKPGLTGLAQIRGHRGATLVEDDLINRVNADLEYLTDWSIWRDLKIIFLTTGVLLHRNAF
jgi:polysaccharide biosynthesis protein PslA